jgi:hypothetical protein
VTRSDRSDRWFEARVAGGATDGEWIALEGLSMAPSLLPGDRLLVRRLTTAPRPGAIVVARRGDALVTHRVLRVDDARIITRGDGCLRADPPLPLAALAGEVVEVERAGRRSAVPAPPGLPRRALSVARGLLALVASSRWRRR